MNLTAPREALLRACQLVSAAVAARTTKPILSNIKAVAQDDALTLTATDTEVGIRYELRGTAAATPGAAVLPLGSLLAILRESPEPDVVLRGTRDGTTVTVGPARFDLPAWAVDEFPDPPGWEDGGAYHEVKAGDLRRMIRRTAFAAGDDYQRFALSGVLFEPEGRTLRLVATDSKRLAVCEGPADPHGDAPDGKRSHLVPQKAIGLLERNLADDGEAVRVRLLPNEALFRTERATIYTRLVEGRYPPYRDILGHCRKAADKKIVLPTAGFLAKVRQAAIMAEAETRRVDVVFGGGKATMQARGQATGASRVELPLPEYAGPEVAVAFDPQFLTEFLRAADGEQTVVLEMADGGKPVLFHAGEQSKYLVMPLAG